MKLIDAWNEFLKEKSVFLCPTSLQSDYRQTSKWLKQCPVQDINEGRKIMMWILSQEPQLSNRRVAMYLKALYRWMVSEDVEMIQKNPIANFKMPKKPQKDKDIIVIPQSEQDLVLNALEPNERITNRKNWRHYSEFMLQTGMRTGEVRALRWKDIKNNQVYVHQNYTLTHGLKNSTKTNETRWVPLNEIALKIIKSTSEVDEFIFPWNRYAFQSWFYDRMKQLHEDGIIEKRYRPYDLRHTAISRWIEAGIPVAQVAKWAGNSTEVIFKHYCNVTQSYEIPVL
jgi:integrase